MPKEKSPAIKKKLAQKGLSQLNRECSLDAFKHNLRREYHAGQTAQGTQHVAIALSVLKRSCGVDSMDRMTPKEIVAMGKGKTMNVESINSILVKAIGNLQENELKFINESQNGKIPVALNVTWRKSPPPKKMPHPFWLKSLHKKAEKTHVLTTKKTSIFNRDQLNEITKNLPRMMSYAEKIMRNDARRWIAQGKQPSLIFISIVAGKQTLATWNPWMKWEVR